MASKGGNDPYSLRQRKLSPTQQWAVDHPHDHNGRSAVERCGRRYGSSLMEGHLCPIIGMAEPSLIER
jgi:hypothetical protein